MTPSANEARQHVFSALGICYILSRAFHQLQAFAITPDWLISVPATVIG